MNENMSCVGHVDNCWQTRLPSLLLSNDCPWIRMSWRCLGPATCFTRLVTLVLVLDSKTTKLYINKKPSGSHQDCCCSCCMDMNENMSCVSHMDNCWQTRLPSLLLSNDCPWICMSWRCLGPATCFTHVTSHTSPRVGFQDHQVVHQQETIRIPQGLLLQLMHGYEWKHVVC